MAFIGNTVQTQGFTPAIDYFNGNGVTVTFTLSRPIASVAQVIVAIDNVIQNPNSAFTVAGNSITFSSAPLSGTNNIWVEYTSLITTYQAISQDPTVIGDIRATGGYLAEGDFGNSFVDGVIVDYVTGLGRVTVGTAEGIALYNGGTASRTERMRIDSSGYVTMPFQPAFYGFRNGGNVTGTNTVVHNAVITNIGSCYNASTGVFTCPVAGVYEVFAGGHAENSQPTVMQISQNNVTKSEEYQNGAAYGSMTLFAILSCAANDQIRHVVATGTFWGGNDSGLRMSVKLIG